MSNDKWSQFHQWMADAAKKEGVEQKVIEDRLAKAIAIGSLKTHHDKAAKIIDAVQKSLMLGIATKKDHDVVEIATLMDAYQELTGMVEAIVAGILEVDNVMKTDNTKGTSHN